MRSQTNDQLVSTYLRQPVALSWDGTLADPLRGSFDGVRLAFGGVATAFLPLEEVVLAAKRARITPGLPARIQIEGGTLEVAVGQADIERWMERFPLPFKLAIGSGGIVVKTEIRGFPITEFEMQLEVLGGWFVLKPQRATFMGVPGYVSSLLRSYLPLPPISEETRIIAIDHEPQRIRLTLGIDDFEEDVTPGLLDRVRGRVLPFAR
jgi:hypothetical protein